MEPNRLRDGGGPGIRATRRAPLSRIEVYLSELVGRLRGVTNDELVGVYAGGSYALGAYEPGRSDLDVAAVVSSRASQALKERVVAAIRHESLRCPARGLELVLYRLAAVQKATIEAAFELNVNTGSGMAFRAEFEPNGNETHWFPIDRSILRQCGIALYGPPPTEVFGSLTQPLLLQLLLDSIRWHSTGSLRGDDAVLNACRAWRYASEGIWSSKPAAGAWALAQPGPSRLVAQALRARHGKARLDPTAVGFFLQTVTRKIERVAEERTHTSLS